MSVSCYWTGLESFILAVFHLIFMDNDSSSLNGSEFKLCTYKIRKNKETYCISLHKPFLTRLSRYTPFFL